MNRNGKFGLFIALFLLIGCYDQKIAEHDKEIKDLKDKYFELQIKNFGLEYLKEQVPELSTRILKLELEQYKEVSLDLSSKGFQRIDTSSGFFLISLDNVVPYGNGYKLSLRIGNISTAKYKGFKFKLKYGKQYDFNEIKKDPSSYEKWEKSLKIKEMSFTNELLPAVWNHVEVILSPAKSEELGHIALSMETNIVSLIEQRKISK